VSTSPDLAASYSHPAARLLREWQVTFDLFKCPAWPDPVAAAQEIQPAYVHFPLEVGPGAGDAVDAE
jgi:hypothetical protein